MPVSKVLFEYLIRWVKKKKKISKAFGRRRLVKFLDVIGQAPWPGINTTKIRLIPTNMAVVSL